VAAQDTWTAHVAEVSSRLLRRQVDNYMVHVNVDDGSRIFIPYVGGFDRYVAAAQDVAGRGYEGFILRDLQGDTRDTVDAIREPSPQSPEDPVIVAE
jgi:hypothetical protein